MSTGAIIAIVILILIMIIGSGVLIWYSTKSEDDTEENTETPQYTETPQDTEQEDEHTFDTVDETPVVPVSQHDDNLIKPINDISKCIPKCWWLSNRTNEWVDFSRQYPTKEGCNKNDGPGGGLYKWDC